MALTNSQYNDLMHRYDVRQIEREREIEARSKRLHEMIPSLKALEEEVRYAYIDSARALDQNAAEQKIKALEEKVTEAIVAAGFPADYLEVPYVCPDCQDRGIVEGVKCHCFIKASNAILFSQSNMEKRLQKTLDDFRLDVYKDGEKDMVGRTSKESATIALKAARKFVEDFPNQKNLYVFGETGTGKTHLACCIATEVINKGYSTIFIKAADFINLCYQKFKDDEKGAMYEKIMSCDLLVLDDLGADTQTKNTASLILTLIDDRSNSGASTIITTNLDITQIKNRYSERVSSRMIGDYGGIHLFGVDLRGTNI